MVMHLKLETVFIGYQLRPSIHSRFAFVNITFVATLGVKIQAGYPIEDNKKSNRLFLSHNVSIFEYRQRHETC